MSDQQWASLECFTFIKTEPYCLNLVFQVTGAKAESVQKMFDPGKGFLRLYPRP
jgi:hypothetical protein